MSVRLLCLPFAGAGASFFHPWRRLGIEGIEVMPIQLPGRERRIAEPPYTDVYEAVEGIVPELLAQTQDATERVALFGHCLGAVLAYEVARAFAAAGRPVGMLVVSGSPPPGAPRPVRASDLDEDAFVAQIEALTGYRHPALEDPELRDLLLPTLHADVRMHDDYRVRAGERLSAPVTAIRGTEDGLVSAAQCAGWREVTTGEFTMVEVPGGHMYLATESRVVLDLVASTMLPIAS